MSTETEQPDPVEPDTTIRTKVASGRQRVERARANVEAAIQTGKQQLEELCEDMTRRTTSGQMQAVDPMKEMEKIGAQVTTKTTSSGSLRAPTPPPLPKR